MAAFRRAPSDRNVVVAPLADVGTLTSAGLGATTSAREAVARQLGVGAEQLDALALEIARWVQAGQRDPETAGAFWDFGAELSTTQPLAPAYIGALQRQLGVTVRSAPGPLREVRLRSRPTFDSAWRSGFLHCQQRAGAFERPDGTHSQRPMMRGLQTLRWQRRPEALVVSQALGHSPSLRMVFVMPGADHTLFELEARLPEILGEWLAPSEGAYAWIDMPPFSVETRSSLCDLFEGEDSPCAAAADQPGAASLRFAELASHPRLTIDAVGVRDARVFEPRLVTRSGAVHDGERLDIDSAFLFFLVAFDPGMVFAMGRIVTPEPAGGATSGGEHECFRPGDPFDPAHAQHCRVEQDTCVLVPRVGRADSDEPGADCCSCGRAPIAVRRGMEREYYERTCESPCPVCPPRASDGHGAAVCAGGYCRTDYR